MIVSRPLADLFLGQPCLYRQDESKASMENARMKPIALTDEDRAILDLESAAVAGHTCKVVLIGAGAPSAERLAASIAGRLAAAPALRHRLAGPADGPVWVDDERFDVSAHVAAANLAPCEGAALQAEVARLFAERLDRSR